MKTLLYINDSTALLMTVWFERSKLLFIQSGYIVQLDSARGAVFKMCFFVCIYNMQMQFCLSIKLDVYEILQFVFLGCVGRP